MPQFIITAIDANGGLAKRQINATDRHHAEALGYEQGLQVISVRQPWKHRLKITSHGSFRLIPFAEELLALQKAGLSIPESLNGLYSKANDSQKPVLSGLIQHIKQGESFSKALDRYPDEFPTLLCALVQAAEQTSNLPQAIEKYLEYARQADFLRQKISNAALYPCLLLLVGGGVLLFLMMYVIPRFSGVYEGLQGDLPWLSEVLLWWGRAMRDHATWVLFCLATVAYGGFKTLTNSAHQQKILQLLLLNTRILKLWQGYRLSRLYRSLGLLLGGGIPIQTSLAHVEKLLGPGEVQHIHKVKQKIAQGEPLSNALAACGLTTEISFQMLTVGERTGSIGEMLTKTAEFLETDTSRAVEAFSRIFEPLLMTLIGLVIGIVVVLMYMPIFELASSLQ